MNHELQLEMLNTDLAYTLRRYYVDRFFAVEIKKFGEGDLVLDMGGKKEKKRGTFRGEDAGLILKYANLDLSTNPDFFGDISSVPVEQDSFDGVILAEVLEHVLEPRNILAEAYRVLKPGGRILISCPFMFHVHPDPKDYGRYTGMYFETVLSQIGFEDIEIQRQGLFFSVLANMLRLWAKEVSNQPAVHSRVFRSALIRFAKWFPKKAFEWDDMPFYKEHWMFSGNTTGYGIVARKGI